MWRHYYEKRHFALFLDLYRVSRRDLFEGATVILTPTERTDSHAVKRVGTFWEALGARLVTLDPVTHDRATAAVSHLPHLVADALVDVVVRMDPRFFEIAGRGSYRLVPFPPERKRIDIGDFYADISRVRETLGWAPRMALRDGLAETVAYYRRHKEHYL